MADHPSGADESGGRSSVKARLTPNRPRRPVENDEYAAFVRRVIRAHARRVAAGDVDALADRIGLARWASASACQVYLTGNNLLAKMNQREAIRMPTKEILVGDLEAGSVEFPDWSSLATFLMHDTGDSGYVWRGQREAGWGLASSLERSFEVGQVDKHQREEREQRALSHFRAYAASYLDWVPADSDIVDWLIIMQHYGCPTRLLDWTESPFVATYFAYSDMTGSQETPGALWQYDARLAMNALQKQPDGTGLDFPSPRDSVATARSATLSWSEELNRLVREYIAKKSRVPLPISPLRPDARMTAQQTILTVEARLDGGISYLLRVSNIPLLFKLKLPAEWRREALRALALMGITAESLFPSAAGVARHSACIIQDGFRHVRSEVEGH